MSATSAILTRSWTVGRRTCTLTAPRPQPGVSLAASIEWAPDAPRRLSTAEVAEYRAGRNKAVAELAAELGITVAVVDL